MGRKELTGARKVSTLARAFSAVAAAPPRNYHAQRPVPLRPLNSARRYLKVRVCYGSQLYIWIQI